MSLQKDVVRYIQSGETTKERLGLEIEHFVVDEKGIQIEFDMITSLLDKISKKIEADSVYVDGHVVGFVNSEYTITLEPACQLEISINPYSSLSEIERIYKEFLLLFEPLINGLGYRLVTKGCLPLVELGKITPDKIPLSSKKRYEFMDRYFEETGKCGKHMMRATAATQISIDYKNEKDLIRKIVVLEKISPVLMIMFENKTINNSIIPGIIDKPHLLRTQIWDDVDKRRTGFFPGSLSDNFGYDIIAKEVYNLPLILLVDNGITTYVGEKSAKNLVEDRIIIEDELDERRRFRLLEHFLSMGFYHFRIKKYIEIRVVDSLPIERALGFVALVKGIVYSDKNLEILKSELSNVNCIDEIQESILRIEEEGFDAIIYNNKTVKEWSEYLVELAMNGLSDEEKKYLTAVYNRLIL